MDLPVMTLRPHPGRFLATIPVAMVAALVAVAAGAGEVGVQTHDGLLTCDSGDFGVASPPERQDSAVPGVVAGLYLLLGMESRPGSPQGWSLVLAADRTDFNTEMLRRLDYFPGDPIVGCNDGLFQRTPVALSERSDGVTDLTLWWTVDSAGHLLIPDCPTVDASFEATYVAAFGGGPHVPKPQRVVAVRIGDAPSCEAWTGADHLPASQD